MTKTKTEKDKQEDLQCPHFHWRALVIECLDCGREIKNTK